MHDRICAVSALAELKLLKWIYCLLEELVSDLLTKKFMLALRSFFSSKGNCLFFFYPDNAKTFKCANKEIQYF